MRTSHPSLRSTRSAERARTAGNFPQKATPPGPTHSHRNSKVFFSNGGARRGTVATRGPRRALRPARSRRDETRTHAKLPPPPPETRPLAAPGGARCCHLLPASAHPGGTEGAVRDGWGPTFSRAPLRLRRCLGRANQQPSNQPPALPPCPAPLPRPPALPPCPAPLPCPRALPPCPAPLPCPPALPPCPAPLPCPPALPPCPAPLPCPPALPPCPAPLPRPPALPPCPPPLPCPPALPPCPAPLPCPPALPPCPAPLPCPLALPPCPALSLRFSPSPCCSARRPSSDAPTNPPAPPPPPL